MKSKTISGLMLLPELSLVRYVELDNNLDAIKKELGFDLADIVMRKINGKYFDIICDDEALLKNNPIPSAIEKDTRKVMLCGSLFICHHDNDGNLTSAKEEEFEDTKLLQACRLEEEDKHPRRFLMIEMEY